MIFAPRTKTKSISTTHTTTKSVSSLHWNKSNSNPHTEIKLIWTTHTNTKYFFSCSFYNQVIFGQHIKTRSILTPAQEQAIFVPHTKTKSIPIPHTKRSWFRPQHWSQVNCDPHSKSKSILHAPDTKTNLISTQTLNQAIFDPHTRPSQLWSLHCEIKLTPIPQTEIRSISTTRTTKSISMLTLKSCHFPAVFECYTYQYMFLWYSSNAYNIITSINSYLLFLTSPYYSKPQKYCLSIYHILFSCYMVYTRLRVTLVAGLHCVPLLLCVILLGGIYKSWVVTVYWRTTNCEYCLCMWQYRIPHIRSVPPHPN